MDPGVYQVAVPAPLTPAQLSQLVTTITLPNHKPPIVVMIPGNPGGRGFTPISFTPAGASAPNSPIPGKP